MNKSKLFFLNLLALIYLSSPINVCLAQNEKNQDIFSKVDKAIEDELTLQMVTCPAGSFIMGTPKDEFPESENNEISKWFAPKFENVERQHKVIISKPFQIGKFEITQKQYYEIMNSNPSEWKGENLPVERVVKKDVQLFCDKLNQKYGKFLPEGYKFDLPTEAQWEYACRAGTTTSFNNGKDMTSRTGVCPNLNDIAWYQGNSEGHRTVRPVGTKKPNAWGIYDMHGNVMEMCKDYFKDYPENEVVDPLVLRNKEDLLPSTVFRGGSVRNAPEYCTSSRRTNHSPRRDHAPQYAGFRIVISPIQ